VFEWLHEPPSWEEDGDRLSVTTAPGSDFWRVTHYGFTRDNGHFFHQTMRGNIVAEVKVTGNYMALYDQAGLMLRVDERTWLKCGLEYVEGVHNLSAVVTRDFSDWSVLPLADPPDSFWIKVERRDVTVEVQYALGDSDYQMLRLAYLSDVPEMQVGPMCASPEGPGFEVVFEELSLRAL
jgi:regulation of enolase protein 1 (concanavalin A-like superfamily)